MLLKTVYVSCRVSSWSFHHHLHEDFNMSGFFLSASGLVPTILESTKSVLLSCYFPFPFVVHAFFRKRNPLLMVARRPQPCREYRFKSAASTLHSVARAQVSDCRFGNLRAVILLVRLRLAFSSLYLTSRALTRRDMESMAFENPALSPAVSPLESDE